MKLEKNPRFYALPFSSLTLPRGCGVASFLYNNSGLIFTFREMTVYCFYSAFATFYVRYKQVCGYLHHVQNTKHNRVKTINRINLLLAAISALGLSLVANFQVSFLPLGKTRGIVIMLSSS